MREMTRGGEQVRGAAGGAAGDWTPPPPLLLPLPVALPYSLSLDRCRRWASGTRRRTCWRSSTRAARSKTRSQSSSAETRPLALVLSAGCITQRPQTPRRLPAIASCRSALAPPCQPCPHSLRRAPPDRPSAQASP
jgi:hypothetical protein